MTTYDYNITQTVNNKVNAGRLQLEIRATTITIALDHINTDVVKAHITFKADLSTNEQTILSNTVSQHKGEPLDYNEPQKVKIVEEFTSNGNQVTQGVYQATTMHLDIPAKTGITSKDLSFPYYISIASAQWFNTNDMDGDKACFLIAPDTIIGTIISGATSGDTEFYVTETVITNIKMGYCVTINDQYLGRVFVIDPTHYKITTEYPIGISCNSGSTIQMTIKIVDEYIFTGVGLMQIGDAKIGTSLILPNTVMRLMYHNINGLAKKLSLLIDYSY